MPIESSIRFSNTLVKTFPWIDSIVITLYLPQLLRCPFFVTLVNHPSVWSVGTRFSYQMFSNSMCDISVATTLSNLSASVCNLPGFTVFPLLLCLMVVLISLIVCGVTTIGRYVGTASMSGRFGGANLFKNSSK